MKLEIKKLINRKKFIGIDWKFSEIKELYKLLFYFNKNKIKLSPNRIDNIYNFKINNCKNWRNRYKRLMVKPTVSSLYNFLLRYGKKQAIIKFKEFKDKMAFASSKNGMLERHGEKYTNIVSYKKGKSFRNSEIQRKNSLKFAKKRKNNPEFYKSSQTTNIEYYLAKGYSKEESIQKVKERQSTFSLEKCIEKYGEKDGTIKWQKRQDKWQESLNSKTPEEIYRINQLKRFTLTKNNESKSEYNNRLSFLKETPIYCKEDLDNFIKKLYESNKKYQYLTIEEFKKDIPKSSNNVTTNLDNFIYKLGYKFPDINKIRKNGKYYQLRTEKGLLRSSYEIYFYNELEKRKIDFELEKRYPNSKHKCDFYIKDLDAYVEIAGTINVKEYNEKMSFKEKEYGAIILLQEEMDKFLKRIDNGFK